MNQDRFKIYASVHVLFIKNNEVLMLLRKNTTSDGLYGLVAGHLEEGETITNALIRESEEEVGVEIKPEDLKIAAVCHSYSRHNNREFIQFYAICNKWNGTFKNKEPEKCGGIDFFSLNSLPENTVPYIKDAITKILNKVSYYEYGWKKQE